MYVTRQQHAAIHWHNSKYLHSPTLWDVFSISLSGFVSILHFSCWLIIIGFELCFSLLFNCWIPSAQPHNACMPRDHVASQWIAALTLPIFGDFAVRHSAVQIPTLKAKMQLCQFYYSHSAIVLIALSRSEKHHRRHSVFQSIHLAASIALDLGNTP